MGNRAVIATRNKDIGVYLHWNGGRDSVKAFLAYCKLKNFRYPENDCYGWARFCQIAGNFLGGGLSLGIDKYENLDTDNWDNGVYIIEKWEIVDREFKHGPEQKEHDLLSMLKEINKAQPEAEQLEESKIEEYVNSLPNDTIEDEEDSEDTESVETNLDDELPF